MGKLIRNGIEYGGGNGTDIFEVTQAEYDALKQAGTLVHNALYVISDGDNLNPTADDIEYSSGVTVKQAIDGVVESGSNTNGYYIKYADGTMICTKKVTVTVNQNEWTSWGQLYESPAKSFGDFAETFNATPTINLTVSGDACWIESLSGQSTTSVGQSRVVRPTVPGVVLTSYIQVIAVGRWKA